jgi:glycosyltransferase involved in cell wall biosynthesis
VIVPTRDRPWALSRCLDALEAQTVADQLEVVAVDDASAAPDAIAAVVDRHARARLIRERGRGPASARNAGARAAHAPFLCFTDDDCEPHVDWVQRLLEAMQAGADAVAGMVLPTDSALSRASETVARAAALTGTRVETALAFAPSGNLACTRSVFESVPFDETFPHPAGEDREWSARLVAAGFTLRSEPAARVVHHQELTLRRFLRQQIRYGEGAFRFRRLGEVPRPLEPPTFYASLIRRAFGQSLAVGILVCLAQAATAVGFARAWARGRRNPPATGTGAPSAAQVREPRERSERPPPT